MHRQRADVAAGKEQRPHDVGIGGEREPLAGDLEHAGVVLRCRAVGLRNAGTKQLADELVHQLAAAAMGQQHVGILLDRERDRRAS